MAKAKLTGVPGGYEVWGVGQGKGKRKYFLVYYVPDKITGKKIAIRYKMDEDEWARVSGGKKKSGKVDRYLTDGQLRKHAGIFGGVSTELKDLGKHPFAGAVHDYRTAARLRPWMLRREMVALWGEAFLEGRDIRESDVQQTKWWKRSTAEERAWYELVKTDPKSARRKIEDNRYKVRKALEQAGMSRVPTQLVNHWGDRYTHGKISDAELQKQIERNTDPYVANASVWAGISGQNMPNTFKAVKFKDKMYVRTPNGDFEITGKASMARFGGKNNAPKVTKIKKVGANKQLAKYLTEVGYGAIIEGEDEVRQLVEEYVGPRQAEGKKQSYYGKWASMIRRDPAARDRLIKELEVTAGNLFANYGEGTKYSDVAPTYTQMFREMWGEAPDETDSFFWNQIQQNDLQASQANLRREGIKRGNLVQQQELMRTALEASNGGIRAAI